MPKLSGIKPARVADLIRLGSKSDGGYVISKSCIPRTKLLIGLGIGDNWSFETDFSAIGQCDCIGVDYSVNQLILFNKSVKYFRAALLSLPVLKLKKSYSSFEGGMRFFRLAVRFKKFFSGGNRFIQKTVSYKDDHQNVSLPGIIESSYERKEKLGIFLKIDIEGAEYKIIEDILKCTKYINGMAIEFHYLDIGWDRFMKEMKKLRKHFTIAHVHGNNFTDLIRNTKIPSTLELSFINKAIIKNGGVEIAKGRRKYPLLGLDYPCDPSRPDCSLEF